MSLLSQDIKTLLSSINIIPEDAENYAKDVIIMESGHYVYYPEKVNGYLNEYHLLHLAAYIHQKNIPWDQEIEKYFAENPIP